LKVINVEGRDRGQHGFDLVEDWRRVDVCVSVGARGR
jgi:hypothetical protein